MNENYLTLNGKRITLTKEQLKTLGIIEKDYNPFDRVAVGCRYYFVNMFGDVDNYIQRDDNEDDALFNSCNYFNDDSVAQQVALHQLLYRKLLKFAYDNNCEDTLEWNTKNAHYCISYDHYVCEFTVATASSSKRNDVYFSNKTVAERAIEKVVKPFMKEHPNFVW